MKYQPGIIHESLQKEFALQLNMDFNIPICTDRRFHEIDMIDGPNTTLCLSAGSIIIAKWFKPYSEYGSSIPYTYIEKVYSNSDEIIVEGESTLSKEFVEINTGKLFTDVTLSFNRDNKINQIIN